MKNWPLALILLIALFVGMFPITTLANSHSKISSYVFDALKNADQNKTTEVEIYVDNPATLNSATSLVAQEKITHTFLPEGFSAKLTKQEIFDLALQSEVKDITPHLEIKPFLEQAVPLIGADLASEKEVSGIHINGALHSVCVVDTGVDFTHPYLVSKNIMGGDLDCTGENGINCPLNPNALDNVGHGTHVAGIIGSFGENLKGVAPGVNLIGLKVAQNDPANTIFISDIARAVNWCTSHKDQYKIAAVNISLGTFATFPNSCNSANPLLTTAVQNAVAHNIAVTIATGNGGHSDGISFPSCISSVIPVAATNKDGSFADYSNYNSHVKVLAPGSYIHSTLPVSQGSYGIDSGTSMAAPMVAGSIAILNQYFDMAGRTMTPPDIENLLHDTGVTVPGLANTFSRINVNNALLHTDTTAPEVTLISKKITPENAVFTCHAKDWNNVSNITLKIFDEAHTIVVSQNHPTSNSDVTENFKINTQALAQKPAHTASAASAFTNTLTTSRGNNFEWNCSATDALGNVGQATVNATF